MIFFKNIIKKIPVVSGVAYWAYKKYLHKSFRSSSSYWENRYKSGGNSGDGSYGILAEYKGRFLNSFVVDNNICSVIEFGCGDGNQLKYSAYENYIGVDVSDTAIALCKSIYKSEENMEFIRLDEYADEQAELALSLDVIYHLVEDDVFEEYMNALFKSATKFVIIYSSNNEGEDSFLPHVTHRNFGRWIEANIFSWSLLKKISNKYPVYKKDRVSSVSDFYIYYKL